MVAHKGDYWYGYARVATVGFDSIAAGTTGEYAVFAAPCKCKIVKVSIIPDSNITGDDTNNFGIRLKNKGSGGSGTGVIATKTFTSGVNATAYVEFDLGQVDNNLLNQGDVVTFEKFENGSGMTMPSLLVKIEYVRLG